MLEATPRLKDTIICASKTAQGLLLQSERGFLRVLPQSETIFRISYLLNEVPSEELPPYIIKGKKFSQWDWEETQTEILCKTAVLTARICRATGAICYENGAGVLLREREHESRTMEVFDSYRMVVDENTVIEEIETPDGIKKTIKQASRTFDKKLYHTRLHLCWQNGEALYGLGQHEEGCLNLRGTTQYLHQANMKIAVPFLVSSKGYGLLFASGSPSIFNDTAQGSYFYTQADAQMDYFFIGAGTPSGAVAGYRCLTGRAPMLPRWALGYIQSQERYQTQQEILDVAQGYRDRAIGLDAIVLDWCSWKGNLWGQKTFDTVRFPSPQDMMHTLHEDNLHFMISIWPNMNECSDNYRQFLESGLLLPASNIYNALSADARRLFWQQMRDGLFVHGIDAWWCDSSEPWTPEWSHKLKPEAVTMYQEFYETASQYLPAELCNAYGYFHAQAIWEGQRGDTDSKRVINLTRNSYTGQQRFGTVLWSGDISASWHTLQKQIPAGLNLCASGLPYWTLDAGGFFVRRGVQWFWDGDYEQGWDDLAYRELSVRWFQYAVFLPMFRGHGTDFRREWWNAGAEGTEFYDALIAANRLRYNLLPYLYSLMGGVWLRNETMMKPLAFHFAHDECTFDVKDQFLLGEGLMVCPVTRPMYYDIGSRPIENEPKTRTVYLPKGCVWVDFWTHMRYDGGETICADAPLGRIPLYVRAGTILPLCAAASSTVEAAKLPYTFTVFTGADGDFTLYEDAGDGYGYEKGEYALSQLHWDDASKCLSVSEREGTYPQILPLRYDIKTV